MTPAQELARLRSAISSRANGLRTVADVLDQRYGGKASMGLRREIDLLQGLADLPAGVTTTGRHAK